MTINAQDKALQDALATLTDEAPGSIDEALARPVPDLYTRRTRIVETPTVTGEPGTYRINVMGHDVAEVKAQGFGEAILIAHDALPEIRAYIFMWDYSVTDSEGMTLRGAETVMRAALQDARLARDTAKAQARRA